MKLKAITAAILLSALSAPAAEARSHYYHRHSHPAGHHGLPWCGIYMGQLTGKRDRRLWLAANWRFEGVNAGGPRVGVIVVWPHHVGKIVGRDNHSGRWVVLSGNDGGRVRSRPRSVAGAIAFRQV